MKFSPFRSKSGKRFLVPLISGTILATSAPAQQDS